jgi:hypothetical protein
MVGMIFDDANYEDRRLLAQRIYQGGTAETFKAVPPERHRVLETAPMQNTIPQHQTQTFQPMVSPIYHHDTVEPEKFVVEPTRPFLAEVQPPIHQPPMPPTEVQHIRTTARETAPVEDRVYTEPLETAEAPTTYSAPLSSEPLPPRRDPVVSQPLEHDPLISYLDNPAEERILANSRIGVYYVPGGDYYNQMLQASQRGGTSWVFFNTEEEAQAAGFRRPRAIVPPPRAVGNTSRRQM